MLNREKYAKEIIDIACSGSALAIVGGTPTKCRGTRCDECGFHGGENCDNNVLEWANSEYVEPQIDWSKVAVDTPILVRNRETENWRKRYFANYSNGTVYAWKNGATSWSSSIVSVRSWNYAKLAESEDADA